MIKAKAHPISADVMMITLNKHAIRDIKNGGVVSLELVAGDRKTKFSFMRDSAWEAKCAEEHKQAMKQGKKEKT